MESVKIEGLAIAGPSCVSDSVSKFVGEEKKQLELMMMEEEEDDDEGSFGKFVPGPLLPLKEQIEKDKGKWNLRLSFIQLESYPQILRKLTPLPFNEKQSKGVLLFTLKEGSEYRLKLTFSVLHNIVSGLSYTNTVWKNGIQVDESRGMVGTFGPQREAYVHTLEEETTPSGILARGLYSAKLKFKDDDKRHHMELDYSFEIRKRN
ncbi:hypothetical protein RD792_003268 [Penstemon davidsonii]|uniref:Rho GDP-dissociation inhibitor 1-like n=1 Tax=Penstemon davidsonii TaxID=160366 RepID=A0ABR0DTA8_9LAMI|nr:hypothetical protein RD792_003268 [Penstemon davidsonii]